MSKLVWGSSSDPRYEMGVDRGVFYPKGGAAVPWNGLISVEENYPDSTEVVRFYDARQYRSEINVSQYSSTIKAFTYPSLMDTYGKVANGLSAGAREGNTLFNFSYRTQTEKGYRIHLVYNASATPVEIDHETINDTVSPQIFTWNIEAVPVNFFEATPSSHFFIDSELTRPEILLAVEKLLYGSTTTNPKFPTIDELVEMYQDGSVLRVVNHHNGTWTATGPDSMINMLSPTAFEINSPTAVLLDSDTYRLSSY